MSQLRMSGVGGAIPCRGVGQMDSLQSRVVYLGCSEFDGGWLEYGSDTRSQLGGGRLAASFLWALLK
eukprot:scaffold15719_cov114-Cylindrotheca_fusiformis.AAC.2